MTKVLCIWDRMGDYHRARARSLRALTIDVHSADLGSSDQLYKWNSEMEGQHHILSAKSVTVSDIFNRIRKFLSILRNENIDAVAIAGYGRTEYILMLLAARISGKKVILFVESWYSRGRIKDWFKGRLIGQLAQRYFASGSRAQQHLVNNLGIRSSSIRTGYSSVDNRHFSPKDPGIHQKILLCVARFSPEKNLNALINAFTSSRLNETWKLYLIGGGPGEEELRSLSNTNVSVISWVNYEELPGYYHRASTFILPSTFEPWGLVVNEAMAASLPVIVSGQCGCSPDLVDDTNGFTFDGNDPGSLSDALNKLAILDETELKSMGRKSLSKIAGYSTECWARTMKELIDEI